MTKIMLVDDEKKIRCVYKRLLTDEGYEVTEAATAREATDKLLVDKVDLVLLDLNMPEIDGAQMIDIVKVYDFKFKVIVASVCPLDEQKKRIPRADGYFDKSEGMDVLLGKIKEVIKSVPYEKNINY